jgi:surface-anchored protein
VTGPAHGTLTGTAPNLTYTPDANYNGLDSFTFEVNDGSLDSAVATVSIAVAAVNDPPVPGDDDFGLTPGNVLHGTVLANDTDVDGDALTAVVATGPSAGSLSLSLNGSFTYTPGVAFAGSDTFTYTASDGHGGTATATVSITARPANPTFTATLSEGHVDIGLAYEADAFDPHVHDEEADEEYAPEDALLEVRREALTTRPAGTAFDFLGVPAGTLYWRLPQSQNPELLFLGFGTEELEEGLFADEEVSFQLIGVDGPGQFAVWLSTDTGPDVLMSTADGVAGDASILLAGGHEHVNWGFTAAGLYGVTLRPIGTLVDGKVVNVDPVTYYFQVEPNAAPASTDDAFGVTPGNVLRGNVLGNDSDADGDVLTATLGSAPTHGTIQFAADGSFTYTPGATFAGTDSFTYTVSDGIAGGTVTATVTITGRPAEPGFEAVLSEGHVDVGIAYEDDAFDPHIHDEVHDIEYEPGEAAYHVRPGALTTRPDSATFDFIGVPAGAQYYRLPQTQDPTLLYLGFGAEELEDGVFQNDQVFVTLVAVDGPGQFSVWENTDSGPDVVFATSDGITDADIAPVIAASHFHVNWAFSQRGIYAVTVRLSGTLVDGTPVTSEDATYYFVVDPANAAPVQTAPAAVTTIQDVPVALTGTNAVSIADSDSTGTFTVELAATNGTVSIPVTPGVTFTTGYGVDDATLVMSGSKDDLNAALAGLTFTPAAGFVGAASLSISTTDSGVLVGDENAETDSDTISVTVSLPTVSVARVADAAEPGTAGAVRFTRTGSLSQSLVVNYTVGGTATPEDDYTPLSGMVTFGIGVASVEVPVTPVDDDEIEETETVIVTITPAAAFTVGGGPATVNVVNDDEIKLDSIVIGSGAGGMVRVVNQTGADVRPPIQPYGATFTGGVRVASADVTGDGVNDIITGAGPGAGPHVKVYDGVTGAEVASFFAFEPTFRGGVFVAAGDLDGDGRAEVFASPDVSGGPRVVVFAIDGGTVTQRASFFGIDDAGFRGGVRIAVGDVNGDLVPDLVVAAGFGGGPRIAIFDGASLQTTPTRLLSDYFVFEQNLRNGAFVALGDATDDGRADLLFGAGPGGSPRVLGLDAAAMLAGRAPVFVNLFAGNSNSRAGVRVAAVDVDGDGRSELVTGAADGSGRVSVYTLSGGAATLKDEFDAFADLGGVFVG